MSCLSRGLTLFALLSLADFFLTWHLLQNTDGAVYESNPVARGFLARYGWAGLAVFKAALVLLCAGACLAISRRRPRTARRVLAFGCAILAGVVAYSGFLSAWLPARQRAETAALQGEEKELDLALLAEANYRDLLARLGEDLIARRRTLAEAVRILGQSSKGRDPAWRANLRNRYRHASDEECLAASLIHHTIASRSANPELAREIAGRLEGAFWFAYGNLPPRHHVTLAAEAG